MTTNRSLRRKQRTHKSASMVATSLLATSALLGTYLGNPRLGRAYATGVCTVENASDFNRYIVNTDCDIIYITENFTATDFSRAIGGDGDERTSLTINGVGEGITITGGGIAAFSLLDNENSVLSLTISNLTITGFRSTGEGGAIYTTGDVTVTNSIFSGNLAGTSGGAIYTNGDVIVTNSIFSGNDAVDYGGAIYAFSGIGTNYVTVTNSTFSDNSATEQYGGAIYTGSVKVTNSTFSGNNAEYGGALFATSGASVTNSTFSENTARTYGGGALSASGGASVTNSTFSENTAGDYGGAIKSISASSITNSIFSANTAGTNGGAIYSRSNSGVTFSIFNTNDTVFYRSGLAFLELTLPDQLGVIVGDPLLGALQNNGGSTLTMLPGTGSPAIDSGSNDLALELSVDPDADEVPLDFDQRGTGFPRIFNATVDMGAVEVQGIAASGGASGAEVETGDGIGVNSLTSVLLQDQSGLDSDWSDHDIFLSALSNVLKEKPNSELKVLADGSVKLTAFLPTDRAFRKLAFDLTGVRPRNDKAAMRVIESLDLETIEKVLLYHVILGDPIGSSDALKANGVTLTTLSGETFSVRVTKRPNIFLRDLDKNLRNPKVLLKRVDINSGNRQIAHVINRVLIPVEDIK